MKKVALIFGITGQDGAYLAKLLLKKNYIVHGVKRRSSSLNTQRIDDIYMDLHESKKNKKFVLHYGDLSDFSSITNLIKNLKPSEIYNLGAQSHVAVSFQIPEYTTNINGLGTLRILEAIRSLGFFKTKFYQAGTSEMFGGVNKLQSEKTPFYPKSPYASAKLFGHWITVNYRESYKMFACNGILFNHESPIRGETFVTKKIIQALIKIINNNQKCLYLGNLYAKRDWGHAKDYVEAMWKILQQKKPDDFVISTGKQYTVKQFIYIASKILNYKIIWKGKGLKEKGYNQKGQCIIRIDKRYFRPNEVVSLLGDSKKARKQLKWKPKNNLKDLIKDMIKYETNKA